MHRMYLAIDIGVSFIKSALVYKNKLIEIERVFSPTSKRSNSLYIHETDSNKIYYIVQKIIDQYMEKFPKIKGVLFSTQMHGFVLTDKNEAVSPYYSWKHEVDKLENTNIVSNLNKRINKTIIENTGMRLRSGLPSINLYIMAKNNQLKKDYSFGTIADYIVSKLTKSIISTSVSNAAGSGLFNLRTNNWNFELIELLNINITLPKIEYDYTKSIGKYNEIDVFIPIGDQQSSLLGTLIDETKQYTDIGISNIATGSQATVVSRNLEFSDAFQTRPFINDYYLLTIPFLPAGRALNSIVNFFEEIGENIFDQNDNNFIWEKMVEFLNNNIEKSSIIANIDFFNSFSNNGGNYQNITEDNFTLKNFLNASIESLVHQHVNALSILDKKLPFNKLYLSGGLATKINYIKIIFDDAFNDKSIAVVKNKEDALNGLKRIVMDINNEN